MEENMAHSHEHTHEHGHFHSPEEKKKQLNRISKAIGHLQHVKLMMERDDDCADVLMQLSAVNSALHSLGKEIINEHMTHCIVHAIEDGDTQAVEEFQKAIKKFL
ncbi:MAG: metal-sensing transcriptional repressor [Firmicutes bacterium]|nr:metal-sensing transcriptional repressor [Bacillota bacterium]